MNSHEQIDNDLEERLLSLRNMVDLALLAFNQNRHELLPTAIEETYCKAQDICFDYCVLEDIDNLKPL